MHSENEGAWESWYSSGRDLPSYKEVGQISLPFSLEGCSWDIRWPPNTLRKMPPSNTPSNFSKFFT
jgi:hypothetical protein